jgi:hypothetical protein
MTATLSTLGKKNGHGVQGEAVGMTMSVEMLER